MRNQVRSLEKTIFKDWVEKGQPGKETKRSRQRAGRKTRGGSHHKKERENKRERRRGGEGERERRRESERAREKLINFKCKIPEKAGRYGIQSTCGRF